MVGPIKPATTPQLLQTTAKSLRTCFDVAMILFLFCTMLCDSNSRGESKLLCRRALQPGPFLLLLAWIILSMLNSLKVEKLLNHPETIHSVPKQLDFNLSRAENALRLLDYILRSNVSEDVKKCALYCRDVLKSNADELNIPLGLLNQSEHTHSQDPDQVVEDSVQEWLLTQFSRSSVCSSSEVLDRFERRKSNMSSSELPGIDSPYLLPTIELKDTAPADHSDHTPAAPQTLPVPSTFGAGVLFECPTSPAEPDCDAADLPFPCPPDERRAILDALRGVDRWDWDVFALHTAARGRSLQAGDAPAAACRAAAPRPTL